MGLNCKAMSNAERPRPNDLMSFHSRSVGLPARESSEGQAGRAMSNFEVVFRSFRKHLAQKFHAAEG